MTPLPIRWAVRYTASLTRLLLTVSLCCAAGLTCAAAVGDQVELNATHPAGVPLHHAPGGTQTFQRVPGGTVATVMATARDGRWLQLRFADARTGWIAARYVGRTIAGSPPPQTSPKFSGSVPFSVKADEGTHGHDLLAHRQFWCTEAALEPIAVC
jgi:hypothetical protein